MIEAKSYYLGVGQKIITSPELAFATILRVKRFGLGYNSSGGDDPADREFRHISSTGQIEFLIPGEEQSNTGPFVTDLADKVTIIFKT